MIFITFIILNIDFSAIIWIIELKFSVCTLKVVCEGSVSQNFDLGPSFDLFEKNG